MCIRDRIITKGGLPSFILGKLYNATLVNSRGGNMFNLNSVFNGCVLVHIPCIHQKQVTQSIKRQRALHIQHILSLIHISEPTRRTPISYAVFCLKKKKYTSPSPRDS
eukprot:TRINITY_DN5590_c0_g1_i1.p2 TRINITY_DN5590_c0_g1~~TRINITY_DN5590_c0_g1_i1.p2  ORF type:complete len:108 (+),score=14.24 TRINITY_DN5590_c0_g1_i1:66-389(+)